MSVDRGLYLDQRVEEGVGHQFWAYDPEKKSIFMQSEVRACFSKVICFNYNRFHENAKIDLVTERDLNSKVLKAKYSTKFALIDGFIVNLDSHLVIAARFSDSKDKELHIMPRNIRDKSQ